MLFSSPDYPLFLIAVFFLYALARWGGPRLAWARIAVMVLLGDVIFMLVAKDPDALWDPIGGALRIALERRVSEARLDQSHADAQSTHFVVKRFGKAFDSVLRACVEPHERGGKKP